MPDLWTAWRDRLAFSTNAFKKTSWEQAISDIAGCGYAGCEIMADQPHFTPFDMSTNEVISLGDALSDAGLRASNVNAFTGFFNAEPFPHGRPTGDTYSPTWIDDDPDGLTTRVDHTLASIRLAAAIGADTVSLQPGGPMIGRDASRDELEARFADGIRRCLRTAKANDVTLAIEPEPGLLLETTPEYVAWKACYFDDEPSISMNFDVGHAFCVGEDPAATARDLVGQYTHVHLEDIAASRVHQHLVPGKGAIDFVALFAALSDVGYGGWVTVELYPFMDGPAGVAKDAIHFLEEQLTSA
ncbi:MAG: sugar phosphate isomerase/epimerase [Planctomycetota bacterium]